MSNLDNLKHNQKLRRKGKLIMEMRFNPAKSSAWNEFKNSGQRITQAMHAYHWLRLYGPACQAMYERATGGRQASICRTFNDLENQFKLVKPVGMRRSPITKCSVTFYEVLTDGEFKEAWSPKDANTPTLFSDLITAGNSYSENF